MQGIVPGDEAGTSEKYRRCRVIANVSGELIPICWTHLATDGSVSFGLYMGEEPLTEIGEASIHPPGKVSFDSKISIEDLPLEERKKTHVSLHPSGVCHIRFDRSKPISRHIVQDWFPVKAGFIWIQAYTAPLGSLPRTETARQRDPVMPFPNLELSARIEVAIYPRTPDASVPLVNDQVFSFVGGSPHHMVRVSIDSYKPMQSTLVIRKRLEDIDDVVNG